MDALRRWSSASAILAIFAWPDRTERTVPAEPGGVGPEAPRPWVAKIIDGPGERPDEEEEEEEEEGGGKRGADADDANDAEGGGGGRGRAGWTADVPLDAAGPPPPPPPPPPPKRASRLFAASFL